MNYNFVTPIRPAGNIALADETMKLWKSAVWSVQQAQEKFLAAYRASVDDSIPGWEARWRTDPNFPRRLADVEDCMKALCRENGMELRTFNRYRKAARAHIFADVPFAIGADFTIDEIRRIKRGEDPGRAEREVRATRREKGAESLVSKKATILPVPLKTDDAKEYVESFGARLAEHLFLLREQLGEVAYQRAIALLRRIQ